MSNEGMNPAITLNPPWTIIKLKPTLNDTWIFETDVGTIHVKSTNFIESINDTVTVSVGTFNNCVRIRHLNEITENKTTEYDYEKSWYAPGVGPVMYRNYTVDWDSVKFSQELISFTVF